MSLADLTDEQIERELEEAYQHGWLDGRRVLRQQIADRGLPAIGMPRKARMARKRKKPKSKLAKRRDNPHSVLWRRKADAVWSKVVRQRAGNRCAFCGERASEAHHLIPKEVPFMRHDLENGMALCFTHHRANTIVSAHGAPLGFAEWLQQDHPDLWAWVQENKYRLKQPYDYHADYDRLQAILERDKT